MAQLSITELNKNNRAKFMCIPKRMSMDITHSKSQVIWGFYSPPRITNKFSTEILSTFGHIKTVFHINRVGEHVEKYQKRQCINKIMYKMST